MILTLTNLFSLDGGDVFSRDNGVFASRFIVGCSLCAVCIAGVEVSGVYDLVFEAFFGRSFPLPERVDDFTS